MGFHIDASVLPRIYGYHHARQVFDSITPIRGGDQSVRRIGKRNDASKWLKQEIRDGVEVFVAGYYSSNVVEFYPSHYNISMCGYNTESTKLFIRAITGNLVYGIQRNAYIPRGFKDVDLVANNTYEGYPITDYGRYEFDYEDKPLTVTQFPKMVKYSVNRKRMKDLRVNVKPFYEYVKAMDAITPPELDNHRYVWQSDLIKAADLMFDQSRWWDAFEMYANYTATRVWTNNSGTWVRDYKSMIACVDKQLKRVDVLDAVEV